MSENKNIYYVHYDDIGVTVISDRFHVNVGGAYLFFYLNNNAVGYLDLDKATIKFTYKSIFDCNIYHFKIIKK